MNKTIKLFGLLISVICTVVFFYIWVILGYDDFLNLLLAVLKIPVEKLNTLKNILSESRFSMVSFFILLLTGFGVLIIVKSKQISFYLNRIIGWAKGFSREIIGFQKEYLILATIIIALSLINNLWNAINMPIFYDEAWTYLNFTKRTFFASISYYPAPNNHILHSVLTNLTYYFPFGQTINLRIPNLLISFLSSICFFYTFSKMTNPRIGVLLLSIFCFLFPVAYYGYLSRGYSLVLFAFINGFYCCFKLISETNSNEYKKYIILFSFFSIIGFSTMPSFLYPYLVLASFTLAYMYNRKKMSQLRYFIISSIVLFIIVGVSYLPVILVSGINSLIKNEFVKPISRLEVFENLFNHFSSTSDFLFSIPLLLVLITVIILTFYFRAKPEVLFCLYIIITPPCLLILHSVIPFPRTWIYLIIPFLLLVGILITTLEKKVSFLQKTIVLSVLCGGFIVGLYSNFKQKIVNYEEFSFAAEEASSFLISQNATNVYCNHPLIETNLIYIFEEEKSNINVFYSREKDTLNDNLLSKGECCDFLVLEKNIKKNEKYTISKDVSKNIIIYKR